MTHLRPEIRVNKNGVPVTKHVRDAPPAWKKHIPMVQPVAPYSSDEWAHLKRELVSTNTSALEQFLSNEPEAVPFVSKALRTRLGDEVASMFQDVSEHGECTTPQWAAEYADMCYYIANGDLEDIYTAQLALHMLHEIRMDRGAEEGECFYRSDGQLRTDIGRVLYAAGNSRFVAGAVDNWNSGANGGEGDYPKTRELYEALYDRASERGDLAAEMATFNSLDQHRFVAFYEDGDEESARLASIPSYIGLVDGIISVSEETGMNPDLIVRTMLERDLLDARRIGAMAENYLVAPSLSEGSL